MKKAFGTTARKTASLKSSSGETITDRSKQMEQWAEHYKNFYLRENVVTETAINSISSLPDIEELDNSPTEEKFSKAIDSLAHSKAPGNDSIPAEVLHIAGKAFARVALKRSQQLADRVYPEYQCGFRAQRSTIDMIFTVRQLQEKCREQKQALYIAFIDLPKAFDLVRRKGLFRRLEKIGCPPKLLSVISSFHDDMQGTVQFDGSSSAPFLIKSGVKQGCNLAPTLFGIFFSLLLSPTFKLFKLVRLRAKTSLKASHSEAGLQRLTTCLAHACSEFGLTISLKKINVIGQDVSQAPRITIGDHTLEVVEEFTYLGSTIASNLSLDAETRKHACQRGETWTAYARQERRLNSFHLRCLRRISGSSWQDRVPTTEVLEKANTQSKFVMLSHRRLRWLGHVRRMEDGRLTKDVLYGELSAGSRPAGRPMLRFKACARGT
ncbi:uncharacterized protein LOC110974885 [Acanthaster planci]|uniref:Uncharacterized protein LOC110974885 n=1 Tax=Acanthaster planci TaxID=133434 RepID=A0A8B7XNX0_ACAPL|nr:uncharacterized protein LOC110974885 [Acanthaster planci]